MADSRLERFVHEALSSGSSREQDLSVLSGAVATYYQARQVLPATLDDLMDPDNLISIPADPVTGGACGFEPGDPDEYRLCANFARPSKNTARPNFWNHEAGRQCFSIRVTPGNSP